MVDARYEEPAVRVRGLRRSYRSGGAAFVTAKGRPVRGGERGGFEAVRGIDLDVPRGSITALLGTNGAGKTSTLEVIEGLAPASAGEISVLGLNPVADRAAVRRRTGVLLQRSGFSGDLTVRETLRQWSSTLSAPRPVDEMLDLLSLGDRAERPMVSLSGGETRRVELACTLMGRPELAILDEPTTGLDPESRRAVWQVIDELRTSGATVLLTTHYLEEAETLADRLEIMHAGRIVRSGTPTEIAQGHPARISFATVAGIPGDLPASRGVSDELGRTTIVTDDLQTTLHALLSWAERARADLDGLDARSASLETVFLAIADGGSPPPMPIPSHQTTRTLEGSLR